MKDHNAPSPCKKMTLHSFEVCFRGATCSFDRPGRFLASLQVQDDTASGDAHLRGVLALGEAGSWEVTAFFRKELRLAPTLVRWQKRSLRYLLNRCGNRFVREGAVCLARKEENEKTAVESREEELAVPEGNVIEVVMQVNDLTVASSTSRELGPINKGPASQPDTLTRATETLRLLSTFSQQQQQPPPSSLPLSTFEREAIRTRGQPWLSHPAKQFSEDTWYPIWCIYQRMGTRKRQVVHRLEF